MREQIILEWRIFLQKEGWYSEHILYCSFKTSFTETRFTLSNNTYESELICILCSFVDMYPIVCGAGIKAQKFKINSHDMILDIKWTGCLMFLAFVSLM